MDRVRISIRSATTGYKKAGKTTLVTQFTAIEFSEGDFVAVVGRNGAGKSTLLRSICNLQPLLSGEILIDKKRIEEYSSEELSQKTAIVLTERIGGFNLKVSDVVANGQMPYTDVFHRMKQHHWDVVEQAMRRTGIYEERNRPVDELSDGMLQKTMIARAIAQQAQIIVLDEPTAFLDYASRNELFIFLKNEAAAGKCVLISTHELDLALRHCSHLLIIGEGESTLLPVSEASGDQRLQAIAGGHLR